MILGSTAKDWVKKLLVGSGVLRLAGQLVSPRAVILAYHSVQDNPEGYADSIGLGIIRSASVFKNQMDLIARRFNPVNLADILLFLRGEKRLLGRSVAVTFDDGYADNFQIVEPILRCYGIPAAFYLTVNLIGTRDVPWFCKLRHAFATTQDREWRDSLRGRVWKLADPQDRNVALQFAFDLCSPMAEDMRRETIRTVERDLHVEPLAPESALMMNWDQVKELQRAGHIVGSHTLTHPNLAHVEDDEAIRKELAESKLALERQLGTPIVHFSYPHPALNPQWNDRTVRITEQVGYLTAVTTTPGPVSAAAHPLLLTRMGAPHTEEQFHWNLERTFLGYPV